MLNPCLETRRINFVVRAVFAQERLWSGLPQIRDGPIDLRLAFRVRPPVMFAPGCLGGWQPEPGVGR